MQCELRSRNEINDSHEDLTDLFALMDVDPQSPQLPPHDRSLAQPMFYALKRSENTVVTPKKFTALKPRRASSPKKTGVPCRKLDFDI